MKSFTAKDAKNKFGLLMDTAQVEPVKITKNGRDFIVVISISRYEDFEAMEDYYWGEKAMRTMEEEEPMGVEAGEKLLSDLLNAPTEPTSEGRKISPKTSPETRKADS